MASGFQFLGPNNEDVSQQQYGTSETSLNFDPNAKESLDAALTSKDYSKEAAFRDAAVASKYATEQVLQAGIPQVSGVAKSAGGYSSSSAELLTNDISAKAQAAGSQVLLDTITKYAGAGAADIGARTGAVAATTEKKTVTSEDQEQQNRSAGALWDSLNPDAVAGGRYSGSGAQSSPTDMGTVICTQMYIDKHLTREVYNADNRYVRNHFHYYTVNGYRFLAIPYVRLMRRNTAAYAVGKFIGVRWSKHCAAHYLPDVSYNLTGFLMTAFVAPLCFCVGYFAPETEFKSLWEGSVYRGQ